MLVIELGRVILVKLVHPLNVPFIVFRLLLNIAVVREVQFEKALSPKKTIEFGRFTDERAAHPENAECPIESTLLFHRTETKLVQFMNALFPIVVRLSPNNTEVRSVLLTNALSVILTTEFGIFKFVIPSLQPHNIVFNESS